jgi:hypothetical protein
MSCWTKLAFAALTLAALSVATPAATANPHARGGYYRPYHGGYYRPYYGGYYGGYGYGYPAVGFGIVIAPRPIIVNQQPVIVAQPILPIQPTPPPPPSPFADPLQQQPGQLRVAPIPVPNVPPVP